MFDQLVKYSIRGRGIFVLIKNVSEKIIHRDRIPDHMLVDGVEYEILGFDYPNKIPKSWIKVGDVIGIQIAVDEENVDDLEIHHDNS